MAKLQNFNVNTEFPAIAKTGIYQTIISQGSVTVAAHDKSIVTQNITVGNTDSICITIEINSVKYPVQNWYNRIGGYSSGVLEQIYVSKINPTEVQIVMGVWNESNSSVSHNGWSADIYINTFNVP